MTSRSVLRTASLGLGVVLAVYVALAGFAAIFIPYHVGDAYTYGAWSRFIAERHSLDYPGLNDVMRGRPLFLVGQGLLWWAAGVHDAVGRLWSLLFGLILLGSVIVLGARMRLGLLSGLLAGALLLLVPEYGTLVAGGLTDVPVAALVAAAAAVLWTRPAGRTRDVLVALLALATVLAKTTGALAVVALALAHLVGPRAGLRRRAVAAIPLLAGLAAGLAYDAIQAASSGSSLVAFLRAGTEGLWAQAAGATRRSTLVHSDWLGVDLRPLLWFAVAYAVLRLVRARHRASAAVAFGGALVGSWLVPDFPLGPFDDGLDAHDVGYLALVPLLLFALAVPDEEAPDRYELARLLVFALPVVIAWAARATYAPRLVAPAWPALVLLMAGALQLAVLGALRVRPPLALAPVAAVALLVVVAWGHVDGLGWTRWKTIRSWGPGAWSEKSRMQHIVWGTFGDEVDLVDRRVGPRDTIATNDGRLAFWLLDRAEPVPRTCRGLVGHRLLVLQISGEAGQKLRLDRLPSVRAWTACRRPQTRRIGGAPGDFVAFAVEGAR